MQYISGTSTSLAAEVLVGLARFRHRVFVEMSVSYTHLTLPTILRV